MFNFDLEDQITLFSLIIAIIDCYLVINKWNIFILGQIILFGQDLFGYLSGISGVKIVSYSCIMGSHR
jgi:hypothetical protein